MPRIQVRHVRKLNEGGFGQVYESEVSGIHGSVAVKELTEESPESLARFKREVRIMARLQHPNIIRVLASELERPPYWFAMPRANGSLADASEALSTNPNKVDEYFMQILKGVEYIHAQKHIHRDLKPLNILIFGERVCVSDFGLGKSLNSALLSTALTYNDKGWGTIHYAAPEQLNNFRTVDQRADIYPLGKILFNMLTNELPWPDVTLQLVDDKYRYIIDRCLKHDPDQRFQSVTALIEEFAMVTNNSSFVGLSETESILAKLISEPFSEEAAHNIIRILTQYSENEYLFHTFFPLLRSEHLENFIRADINGFLAILRAFDGHVAGWLDFDFCDVVSDLYTKIARESSNLEIDHIILTRLLIMGGTQNRWYVMDAFCDQFLGIYSSQISKTMVAKQVIEEQTSAFKKTYVERSYRIDNADIPLVLREAIRRIVGD